MQLASAGGWYWNNYTAVEAVPDKKWGLRR